MTGSYAEERIRTRRALLAMLGASSVLTACSSVPSAPSRPGEIGIEEPPDTAARGRLDEENAREAAFLALSLVDTPYRYGGNTPKGGFDCSGLIVYVFRTATGFALPRTVAQLARFGTPVRLRSVRTGDLVLFDTVGRFSHAGIYVGAGRFVHAPSSGGVVRLDGVQARYWKPRFSGVRRI